MLRRKQILKSSAAAALLACCLSSFAFDLRPDAVEVIGGMGKHSTRSLSAGLVWDWDVHKQRRALLTAQTELILSHWRADALGGGTQGLQQVTLLPLLRMELDRGRSPWYLELGIGASYLTRDYVTPEKKFSTRWNFYDVLGGGYRFGESERHEIGLRYVHVSNAGLKLPNPGEDFLQLRYAVRF